MREETVFFEQAFAIAHGAMMPLDENRTAGRGHNAGRGERARAHSEDARGLAQRGKASEKSAHFVLRKRRPVGGNERAVHAVSFYC